MFEEYELSEIVNEVINKFVGIPVNEIVNNSDTQSEISALKGMVQ